MGYCNRCGEISSSGKCRKCGGRPVASIITSLGTDNSVLVADKWQSQYAESILAQGDNSIRLESPKRNSRQGLNRILSVTLQNACGNCDKKLRYDTPSYLEENVYYCQDCHVQLFSKGLCAACDRPVFPKRDAFIDHGERSWHRNCFRCHGCFALIDHKPMVDLKGRPCCEPCLLAQAGTKPTNTTSTPNLSSPRATYFVPRTPTSHNRPRISPQTFNQQKQPTEEPPPLPPLSPASSIRSSISSGSPVSISSTSSSPLSSARRSPLVSMSSPSPPPSTRVCHACDKQLSGPRVRVPIANGEVWYHYDCLTCHGCGEHFTESRFVSQGKLIYHPKCVPPPPAVMDNKTARYYCCECQRPIIDKCLRNGTDYYHTQCFRCAQCHRVLPYDQPFFEVNNKPHCETCSNNPTSPTPIPSPLARGTNPLCSQSTPLLKSSSIRDNQPSTANVLAHRSRPLPKLGGSKICPRCKTSIAISEDTPGPRASRWHKKCLQCIGCRKQLDSGAKVIEGEHGEWVVRCRSCMDEKWERQKFVR